MDKLRNLLCLTFIALLTVSCQTSERSIAASIPEKSDRFYSIGKAYFKNNKFLEAMGPLYEALHYEGNAREIECYIGLCISYIEESTRGKSKIDNYLIAVNDKDAYLLNRIANVYGFIYKDYKKALRILDMAIELNKSTSCWDYIEKAYMFAFLKDKAEALKMLNIAFAVAKETNDFAGMETAPQLIEQIDQLISVQEEKT